MKPETVVQLSVSEELAAFDVETQRLVEWYEKRLRDVYAQEGREVEEERLRHHRAIGKLREEYNKLAGRAGEALEDLHQIAREKLSPEALAELNLRPEEK